MRNVMVTWQETGDHIRKKIHIIYIQNLKHIKIKYKISNEKIIQKYLNI